MSFMKSIIGSAAAVALTATAVLADPAIIFDLGGKFDNHSTKQRSKVLSVGLMKQAAHSAKSNFKMKLSVSKLYVALLKPVIIQ